jgi:hypothetical protein
MGRLKGVSLGFGRFVEQIKRNQKDCSPDEALRNPEVPCTESPDFTALHPGCLQKWLKYGFFSFRGLRPGGTFMSETDGTKKLEKLLGAGSEAAGAAVGGGLGFLLGGPVGAVAGGVISVVISRTLDEFSNRVLSHREQVRVEVTAQYALLEISNRLQAGQAPRRDGFFSETVSDRTYAEEVFEGVLFKAKNEVEERKLHFLGNAFANIAFRADISPATAHLILKISEGLTYRQMCLLAFIAARGEVDVESLRRGHHTSHDLNALRREEMSLHDTDLGTFGLLEGIGPWTDKLSPLGQMVIEILGLSAVPAEHVKEVENLILQAS